MQNRAGLIVAVWCAGGLSAGAVDGLIAGFETWPELHAGTASRTAGVAASYRDTGWTYHMKGANTGGTFGTLRTTPAADVTNESKVDGRWLPNGREGTHEFTIQNTSSVPIRLSRFHFDSASLRHKSSRNYVLEVMPGGSISKGIVVSDTVPPPAVPGILEWHEYDIDLTCLPDHELDVGGSVTFRLAFAGGIAGSAGHHQMLDNVAVSAAPEPDMLGLISFSLKENISRQDGWPVLAAWRHPAMVNGWE